MLTFGNGCTSRSTLLFSERKSTQILTEPDDLGTTTIPVHHSVGSFTGEITLGLACGTVPLVPYLSVEWSHYVARANGFASGFSCMV